MNVHTRIILMIIVTATVASSKLFVEVDNGLHGHEYPSDILQSRSQSQGGSNNINSYGNRHKTIFNIPDITSKSSSSQPLANCIWEWDPRECGLDCSGDLREGYLRDISTNIIKPCSKFHLRLHSARLHSLPRDFFSKIGSVDAFNLEYLNVVTDYFLDPTPDTSPFRGVSFRQSASIRLSDVTVRVSWNWFPLQELRSTTGATLNISIDGSDVKAISSDFSRIASGSVGEIDVSNCGVQLLGRGSFENFDNVSRVLLPNNNIRDVRRSILPKTPERLEEIDLRYNKLTYLDRDMFSEMPKLKKLSLQGNPLREIGQKTFQPIINRALIQGLSDLPLVCDCKLRWLKEIPKNQNVDDLDRAICRRPLHLRGKPLLHLSAEHLLCN